MDRPVLTAHQHSLALGRVLHADVVTRALTDACIREFRYFESGMASVLRASGDPMHIQNSMADSDDVLVMHVRRGNCVIHHPLGRTRLAGGEFVIFHGYREAEVVHCLPYEIVGLRFSATGLAQLLPEWDVAEFEPLGARCPEARSLFRIAEALLETGARMRPQSVTAISTTLLALLHQSLNSEDPSRNVPETNQEYQLRRIKQFCRRHLGSPELGVAMIGSALGLSRAQLHRLFNEEPITLMAWVQDQRLLECRRMLEQAANTQPLSEIALAAGFKTSAHFSRAYKDRFGVAPSETRRDARLSLRIEP